MRLARKCQVTSLRAGSQLWCSDAAARTQFLLRQFLTDTIRHQCLIATFICASSILAAGCKAGRCSVISSSLRTSPLNRVQKDKENTYTFLRTLFLADLVLHKRDPTGSGLWPGHHPIHHSQHWRNRDSVRCHLSEYLFSNNQAGGTEAADEMEFKTFSEVGQEGLSSLSASSSTQFISRLQTSSIFPPLLWLLEVWPRVLNGKNLQESHERISRAL